MVEPLRKYPRTRHIQGSRQQLGDGDLESVPFADLAGRHLVVEEKIDGANCGMSFTEDGALRLQSRGHFLAGGRGERQFSTLKQWAACHTAALWEALGPRYIMYGEWLFAKHTVFYDRLPHYFLEFDVLDRDDGAFLSTTRRQEMLEGCPVVSVPILHGGALRDYGSLVALTGPSNYVSPDPAGAFESTCGEAGVPIELARQQTDLSGLMEGLYLKVEEGGIVTERHKWLRPSFIQARDSEDAWRNRPITRNRLVEGVDIFRESARPETRPLGAPG